MIRRLLIALAAIVFASSCAAVRREKPTLRPDGQWTSFDGKSMPWRSWLPPAGQKVRGVIVTIHGLSGASADFHLLGERLPALGYAVYGYELRGQGFDADLAERGDIPEARTWLRDLSAFHALVSKRHPRAPVIWYGESLGSLIALHTAGHWELGSEPSAMILAAPIAGLRMEMGEMEKFLLKTSSRVLPRMKISLGTLAGVDEKKMRVTSGTTHGGQMAQTPHHVGSFTLRLLREIDSLIDDNAKQARRLDIPLLMLASPHDIVSSPDQVQSLFKLAGTKNKKLLWYPSSYHLLLHDVEREQVVNDVTKWLARNGQQKPRPKPANALIRR